MPTGRRSTRARDGDGAVLDHPHFVQYVYEYLAEKYPDKDFTKGGFNIYTTIDTALQNRAEEIVAQNIQQLAVLQRPQRGADRRRALERRDPGHGRLRQLRRRGAGGPGQHHHLGAATGLGDQTGRLRGGLRAGLAPRHRRPRRADPDRNSRRHRSGNRRGRALLRAAELPANFNGAVTVRTALANSLNIPAVKAVEFAGGAEAIVEMARRMGIKHELSQPPADYGLSIALGSGDVWPLELTNAYATIANLGKYVPVTPILKITDSEDNVLYELEQENTLRQCGAGDPARDRLPARLDPDRQRERGR